MKPQYSILDIGTGRGNKLPVLKRKGVVTGIDLSPAAIAMVKRRFPQNDFFVMSCEKLDFSDSSFSEIHCYDVLEHVTDLSASLSEIHRVLKPGGKLFVEVPFWRSEEKLVRIRPTYFSEIGHQRIFREGDERIFLKHGFSIDRTKKKHGIVNYELQYQFRRGVLIHDQQGGYSHELPIWLKIFFMLFSENLFLTPVKYLFPVWIITLPLGILLSQVNPKTIRFELVRS